jgi:hypothetical protein
MIERRCCKNLFCSNLFTKNLPGELFTNFNTNFFNEKFGDENDITIIFTNFMGIVDEERLTTENRLECRNCFTRNFLNSCRFCIYSMTHLNENCNTTKNDTSLTRINKN